MGGEWLGILVEILFKGINKIHVLVQNEAVVPRSLPTRGDLYRRDS